MCCCVVLEGLSDLFDVLERLVGFYLLSYARRRQNPMSRALENPVTGWWATP